ncbi:ABC transporter ATP-binding protein [Pseudorhodoplanes sp.]|uniref:ABC transporter ATP-binding protein n=1 Tax=Pseudorhodoplanes sp. TaxID=1934341 RepID=UPI003D14C3BC
MRGLRVENLSKTFGGLTVAKDINLSIEPGERVALIGPNGAGKTTLVNLITGLLSPSSGRVSLDGADITGQSTPARARLGLIRTFQVTRLFPEMTAREHLALALLQKAGRVGVLHRDLWADERISVEAQHILERIDLGAFENVPVTELAYGQQRLLEFGISLALAPRVLLLDEPAAGVPSSGTSIILSALDSLPADLGVLMIDHDMDLVFRFAQRIIVMERGSILLDGAPQSVAADPLVRKAYLGSWADAR